MTRPRLEPFLQGQLDGLCGVYAAINAIRLALGHRAAYLTTDEWQDLFSTLLIAADDAIGAATATAYGINTKPLLTIMESAVRHMADEHDVRLTVSRVLKRKERPPLWEVLQRLEALMEEQSCAVLISLTGHLDHWTVLRAIRKNSLELFDSSQFARVKLANCRMSFEPPLPMEREHIIQPRAVLRVSVIDA